MGRKRTVAGLAAVVTVAILGAALAQGAAPAGGGSSVLPLLAGLIALAALGVAVLALRRARQSQAELTRFTRSIEMALRELSTRSERDAASIGELNRKIGDEIRELTEAAARAAQPVEPAAPAVAQPQPGPVPAEAAQVVRLPPERPSSEPEAGSHDAVQRALARIVASGEAEVSLQPIISVSQSAAAAFEVHMHVEPGEGGRAVDIRRLAQSVPGVDQTAFEVALVRAAIAAGRRQLGSATERMPFHVAISEALLSSADEVRSIAELAQLHKPLTASLVFSIPAALLSAGGETRQHLDLLTSAGFRLAAENWDGGGSDAAAAARRGVAFVKVAANRLLDRERSRRRGAPGVEIAAAAAEAGLTLVATAVSRDEDAVGLIDLGIDLMVGERFSGPRRIRSAAARQAAMTGT
ncbi:MAG: EAL domain-containing protein [Rhizobiaceae bacterium]|nr:EAL domain-containing protein [Rhizobiaceae bacterium]